MVLNLHTQQEIRILWRNQLGHQKNNLILLYTFLVNTFYIFMTCSFPEPLHLSPPPVRRLA